MGPADYPLRQLEPQWNKAMIAASIAISFLGAFTATQLMCHARMSLRFSEVFVWALLGSMIFGFCSIWSLHEVAMLAYEFDLPIHVDAPLTIISALLAVSFTFVAVATDLLWDRYQKQRHIKRRKQRHFDNSKRLTQNGRARQSQSQSSAPLLQVPEAESDDEAEDEGFDEPASRGESVPPIEAFASNREELSAFVHVSSFNTPSISSINTRDFDATTRVGRIPQDDLEGAINLADGSESRTRSSSSGSLVRRSVTGDSNSSSFGLSTMMDMVYSRSAPSDTNVFLSVARLLIVGCTFLNIVKGFLWSLAVTSMHYCGIFALTIPNGYYVFNPWLVTLSGLISWAVCTVGCILMATMETHLPQQIMFSIIAAAGVAGMHFTGMAATTFWTTSPAEIVRGYPPELANAVVGIAFVTCIIANVLLAHSATVSRNKLAEIVWTRKELWRTTVLKEHAEASARARSDFIASASHEIRTPLHHLQGYSDLLAQTELTDEGRALLIAIQRATKTLSLITNNVLDWSKFEQNSENAYRPTALDIRAVCESIIVLLPNLDEEANVQLFVVVSPDVPKTLFLDETWIHRILMNLLSNALKFTRSGYIMLAIEMNNDDKLIATVRDTGCGLDPAFIPEMWTPFKQGEIRGSARGTGLGLSIIKQLLHGMKGGIEVNSNYEHMEGVGPQKSGTVFTVTLPVSSAASNSTAETASNEERPRVAILSKSDGRGTEGLRICWETFGFDVTMATDVSELEQVDWKYVWAELNFLQENVSQFHKLIGEDKRLVLVPYDTQDSLEGLPGILTAPNFFMLQRPLIWHTFEKRILAATQRARSTGPSRALRFASEVEVLNSALNRPLFEDYPREKHVVLLVEDNPVSLISLTNFLTSSWS